MAAVLFRGIGQVFEAIGQVLCLPCRACGMGCDAMGGICKSPFFPYLALTFLLNLPPVVKTFGIMVDFLEGEWCSKGQNWLLLNAALCIVHMVASMYIVHRIRYEAPHNTNDGPPTTIAAVVVEDENNSKANNSKVVEGTKVEEGTYYAAPSAPQEPGHDAASVDSASTASVTEPLTMARIKHVLCDDPGMAIYLLFAIFWAIWMCIGVSRYAQIGDECGDAQRVIGINLICGWLYMGLVGVAFVMSLCCMPKDTTTNANMLEDHPNVA